MIGVAAEAYRLNVPAGLAQRFEPGETKEVELVLYGGARSVRGFSLRHLKEEKRFKSLEKIKYIN